MRCWTLIGFFVFVVMMPPLAANSQSFEIQNKLAESGKWNLINEKDAHEKLALLLSLAANEPDAKYAVGYAELAINLADSLKLDRRKAEAFHSSGVAWKRWGDNLKSVERLNQALDYYQSIGAEREIARVHRDLGETYRAARGFAFSEEALQKALEYFASVNDTVELAKTYNRIAATRFEVFFTAPDYNVMDSIFKTQQMTFEVALNRFPEMRIKLDSLNNALDSAKTLADYLELPELIISNENISVALSALFLDYEVIQANYDAIISKMYQYDILDDLPLVLINKARTYSIWMMNQPEKAIPLAYQSLEMAQKNNIRMYEYLAYELLHFNHKALGNYEDALKYALKKNEAFARFHNEDLKLHLTTQGLEFQIREREMELKYRRIQLIILVTSIFAVALVFGLFTIAMVNKNRKLQQLLNEVNAKAQIIADTNAQLAAANAEKDRFFSIIAHDLRSPFNAFLGFTELMTDESYELTKSEMKSYAGDIRKSALLLFGLLENLLEWSRLQRNVTRLDKQRHPLKRIVSMSLNTLMENALKKEITINIVIDEAIVVFADDKMMQSVFRNLISNAIKFTPRGGSVTITANRHNGGALVVVSDTGVGIKPAVLPKLFRIDENVSSAGTEGEPSTGLGLILCAEFILKHNGKIWVESSEGKGSKFFVFIPGQDV